MELPLVQNNDLVRIGRQFDDLASRRAASGASRVLSMWREDDVAGLRRALDAEFDEDTRLFEQMVALQEELDWSVYRAAGLVVDVADINVRTPTSLPVGFRPFEYLLAQDQPTTQWFSRNRYGDPRRSVEAPSGTAQRTQQIRASAELTLLEQPEYKRRWSVRNPAAETEAAAATWLLDATEAALDGASAVPRRELIDKVFLPPQARAIARLLDVDEPTGTLAILVAEASVPFVAAARYSDSGLAKHAVWCSVWAAQRAEDAGAARATTTVEPPPRYGRGDFAGNGWALRGKLDVPKERFISYPCCESDEDGEPVYGWAGWNHLQRAQTLASLYQRRKTDEGWTADRLTPMLAGLLELLPWLKQWHNKPDAEFGGLKMGDYFAQFLDGECQTLGLTHSDLEAWRPPKKGAKKAAANDATPSSDVDVMKPKKPRKKKAAVATLPPTSENQAAIEDTIEERADT